MAIVEERVSTRVLVVDDDPWTRITLAALLGSEGFSVLEASNGEEGLRLSVQDQPDIVLLDLALPTLSGVDVLRELSRGAATRQIPVLVVSSYCHELDAEDAARAAGLVSKPFEYDDLVSRVKSVTASRLAFSA